MGGHQGPPSSSSYTRPQYASDPIPVMQHVPRIYEDRLNTFIGTGQYSGTNLRSKLHDATASGRPAVKLSVYSPPDHSRPTFKEAICNKFESTGIGKSFGPSWSTHWFKVQLTVPPLLLKKEHLEFHWDANNEGMIWSEDGEPLQGLTGGDERIEWILPKSFRDGKEHIFYVEMACNGMFGNATSDIIQAPDPDRYFQLQKADIVAVNLTARALFVDFWILKDAAREFPQDGWQRHKALAVANEVINCYETGDGSDACLQECRDIAAKYIGTTVDSAKVYNQGSTLVNAIGHCHIDTCWLWPWAETKRKIARSWSNQCDLMERYPEHRFCCSQAQQFKWLKKYYPSLFDRVKTKVKEGKFQPIGGSWVEHDTNMPNGESLVRQFLYGQRFFQSHFGERSRTFWLPDTFGYSSQLPQICRLAGMDRFFTQKLSWNNINTFPHTTFNWVGIDNSQVLCHMAPAETYTAEADLGDVVRSITQHKTKDQDSTSLLPFGKGDGGGGPTWQQIEKLRRCRGISNEVGQLPPVKVGDSVDDFFAGIEKKTFPSWHGELYLELHRGCYTTQAKNKRNNRFVERLLHDVEYFATLASIYKSGYRYPKADIDAMWEDVLLMQFHDCLPGSCIGMVYEDSDRKYKKVFRIGEKLLGEALSAPDLADEKSVQKAMKQDHPHCLFKSGIRPMSPCCGITFQTLGADGYHIEGQYLKVAVAEGVITSLYDKSARRELVPKGSKANQLVIFDDKPLYWQAWDVEVFHLDTRKELKPTTTLVTHNSYDNVSLTTTTKISNSSSISTTLSMSAASPSIEFASTVSWHETQKFLKVEFPTTLISNTGTASYETQYGIITRPVHYNTSWDMAKFEVVSHRFADLSENNYGLSVLNDSKYGFAISGSTMRLSLLRAPKAPDATADMGTHHFRYSIFPHKGPLGHETVQKAREFNSPITAQTYPILDGKDTQELPLFPYTDITECPDTFRSGDRLVQLGHGSDASIVLDWIKRGEDDEDVRQQTEDSALPIRKGRSVIVRVYEALGGLSRGTLLVDSQRVSSVCACNLLEDDGGDIEKTNVITRDLDRSMEDMALAPRLDTYELELKAFEVGTLRLRLR